MAMPPGMMPGAGGPPPPGAGGPGGGMGGPEMGLQILAGMQQSPPPSGEQEALRDATQGIQFAMGRVQMRSAKAAKLLAEALAKIQAARESLDSEPNTPMQPPPSLGFPGAGGGGLPPGGPPMGPPGM